MRGTAVALQLNVAVQKYVHGNAPRVKVASMRNTTHATEKSGDWISASLRRRMKKIYEQDYNLIGG